MEGFKRPTRKETDDDLIREQDMFYKQKIQPASKFKRIQLLKKSDVSNEPNSKTVQDGVQNDLPNGTSRTDLVVEEKQVVFDVKERNVSSTEPFVFKPPDISPLDINSSSTTERKQSRFKCNKKSQSIFLQSLEKKDIVQKFSEKKIEPDKLNNRSFNSLIDGSGLSKGLQEEELQKIHQENLAKISSMSKDEISEHQEQLKQQLDPTLIKFIQNRGKKINAKQDSSKSSSCSSTNEFPGIVLRKEGNEDCDAVLLEKLCSENNAPINANQSTLFPSFTKNEIQIPEGTKKLLNSSNKGQWKNMNRIEKEKLQWMSALPKANPVDLKTGITARFDFEGKLLAHDLETPTYKGLHHHGDEPEVAGYSLEELFLLARSTVQSQRITALHTIAHVLDNYWYGALDGCFDDPLLPMMLQAGIVPLLRWALDDTSTTSVAATITAIHSLLICKPDEICLQRTFCWFGGHILPHIEPHDLLEPNIVIEELTDADLIKLDVIKAFLRMDILPRFAYILQVLQPAPLVCKLVLEICAHFAQHSLDSANQVANHSALMKIIFEKFLPLKWLFVDGSKLSDSVDFTCPMASAVKLIRILVSSSKDLADYLISNYDLVSNLMVYLTLHPNDGKVHIQDIQLLMIESMKLFHNLLHYGLASNVFTELFPVYLNQMEFCLNLDLYLERSKHIQDFEYATHLYKTLELVAVQETLGNEGENTVMLAVFQKSLTCLKKWLWQFTQNEPSDHGINLLAACINFISVYCEKLHTGLVCEVSEPCLETKRIFISYLMPFLKCQGFIALLSRLKNFSLLLDSSASGNLRDGKTVASLGSVLWKSDIVPIIKEGSPFPLLLAVSRLCILQKQLFSDVDSQVLESFLKTESITEYLKLIISEKFHAENWFSRFEIHFISQLLHLASIVIKSDEKFWFEVAAVVLPIIKAPYEYLIENIFENIIFKYSFLKTNKTVVLEIEENLPLFSKSYASCFLKTDAVLRSRNFMSGFVSTISLISKHESTYLLPIDWIFGPILKGYHNSKIKPREEIQVSEAHVHYTNCLQWIKICHVYNLPLLKGIPGCVEFSYLCLIFLLDEDTFHLPAVKKFLKSCFLSLLKNKKINLTKLKWENFSDFDEVFLSMLNQFQAVSYGDHLFGNFLLFPLQQRFPSRWKKILLTEYAHAWQFLRVPVSEICIPLKNFLEPIEEDDEIILLYYKSLVTGALRQRHCPIGYLMAIHHINQFLFSSREEKIQRYILNSIIHSHHDIIRLDILLYSEVDQNEECGFRLKEDLLSDEYDHLSSVIGYQMPSLVPF